DITATIENRKPNFALLEKITSECFMPLGYGGGIRDMDDIRRLLKIGVEKIILNAAAVQNPSLIREAANYAGSQAVVISIDVKKSLFGKYEVYIHSGAKNTKLDPVPFAVEMEKQGAGEIFINSIDHDGAMQGYDLGLIKRISSAINIPLVACGGAGNIQHLAEAIQAGASAAAAGSMFVFQGPLRGVLISYPAQAELRKAIP
ncbi:MAG: HisA/HisF-related TIM barrel protein, partial [Anaerolineales bacterium]